MTKTGACGPDQAGHLTQCDLFHTIPELPTVALPGSATGDGKTLGWVRIHWFELVTLILLCFNLWFTSAVLHALKETNRQLAFLTRLRWGAHEPESPTEQ